MKLAIGLYIFSIFGLYAGNIEAALAVQLVAILCWEGARA
jgi:hypothetical protein